MKLLDAATVVTGTGTWTRGWDSTERGCGGVTVYLAECDPAVTADVVGDSTDLGDGSECPVHRVQPFGAVATLVLNTRNEAADDFDWLANALRSGAELPVARGLLVRQGVGETWLGNPAVQEIPAPVLTDPAAVAKAVSDARVAYFAKAFGLGDPILHVNPANLLALRDARVVELDPSSGLDRSIWGDPVVISEGYYDIPGMTATPPAFFTGPIEITLSEVNREDIVVSHRRNRLMYQATLLAAIDTAPCGIVRLGPAPAPVAP